MTKEEQKELCDNNPEEYYRRLYHARALILDRGYGLLKAEGKSLIECEKLLQSAYEIRINPDHVWVIVRDKEVPKNKIYLNGLEITISQS